MRMQIEEFKQELDKLAIPYSEAQLRQLEQYYELLVEWNKKINLTAIVEKDQIYLKHFYDSLTLESIISLEEQKNLCDIGTGAGFPGIVIKIFFPKLHVTLVDSLQKRITFLDMVIEKLGLQEIETYHARAEEFAQTHREKFDIVTARAVAHLRLLIEYGIPMVKVHKYLIAMKGNILEEIEESKSTMIKLKCHLNMKKEFDLPHMEGNRTLLLIQKDEETSHLFPRKYSEMKKKGI